VRVAGVADGGGWRALLITIGDHDNELGPAIIATKADS